MINKRNIGDVLLSTPVFTVLKANFPHLQIDVAVGAGTESMLEGNPHIDNIIVLRWPEKRGLAAKIRHEWALYDSIRNRYDLAINLTPGDRGVLMGWISGASVRSCVTRKPKWLRAWLDKRAVTHWVSWAGGDRHYVENHLDSLRRLGVRPHNAEQKHPVLMVDPQARADLETLLARKGREGLLERPFVLVHPSSRWMFKAWPPAHNAELINRLGHELGPDAPIVLTSGPDGREMDFVREIQYGIDVPYVDLTGQLSLKSLYAAIAAARLYIGVDSAPMHMASAARTPLVALFGPSQETNWGPWGAADGVIAHDGFPCRPCQRDGCGGGKVSDCLTELSVDQVFERVMARLAQLDAENSLYI
ncbi:putative lipopolysaccharide heptosyltransferase III [Magnetofaba australis IT-1]|uniref:Putative lipopolysaccharide heptosyltransferase III n=1 Tax=Magnetofaba australis IT-1 TaxID=1434232 RepID=A0A1Y2K3Y5_9PROT|nr:putative lipopolysaccharide heptosyltransferase III [Magnetofaba australis IT-1]